MWGSTFIVWFYSSFYIFSKHWRILRRFPTSKLHQASCFMSFDMLFICDLNPGPLLFHVEQVQYQLSMRPELSINYSSFHLFFFSLEKTVSCTLNSSRSRDEKLTYIVMNVDILLRQLAVLRQHTIAKAC